MAGGAPIGNQNAARGRVWRTAIEQALEIRGRGDRVAALKALAEKLLARCDDGDTAALRELGDRLEGKAAQIIGGDPENPLPIVSIQVERVVGSSGTEGSSS